MAAYMIILAEISDFDGFMNYAKAAAALIPEFGGEYIVRGAKEAETLEGDWPDETKVVISKWPSMDAARKFWNSPEYEEIKKLRAGNATVSVRIVEAV